MKKVVLFVLFVAVTITAYGKSEPVRVDVGANVACCDPPPTCPKYCPPMQP